MKEIWIFFFLCVYRICGLLLASDNKFRFISCAMSKWFCLFRRRAEKRNRYYCFFSWWIYFIFCFLRKKLQNWLNIYFQFGVWHWFAWIIKSFIECGIYFHLSSFQKSLNRWKKQIPNVFFTIKLRFRQISVLASSFFCPSTHKHTNFYCMQSHFIICRMIGFEAESPEPKSKTNGKWRIE